MQGQMSINEKIRVHIEIERERKRKEQEWKDGKRN